MKDNVTLLLSEIKKDLLGIDSSLKGTVVAESQQIAGTLPQRQELPLSDRISPTREGAEVQKNLEAAKSQSPVMENTEQTENMSNLVADKYVDEILHKFLGSLR